MHPSDQVILVLVAKLYTLTSFDTNKENFVIFHQLISFVVTHGIGSNIIIAIMKMIACKKGIIYSALNLDINNLTFTGRSKDIKTPNFFVRVKGY